MPLSKEERKKRQSEGGAIGGSAEVPKGFSKNRKLASEAGRRGARARWAKENQEATD